MRSFFTDVASIACGLALLLGGAVDAAAGADLVAAFDYTMPPRFQVPALPEPQVPSPPASLYFSGPVDPGTWRVDLDACASSGPIASFTWRVDGRDLLTSDQCDGAFFESPSGSRHLVTLVVSDAAGRTVTRTREVLVQNWLIVGVGDSYGSGEGSPDEAVFLDPAEAAQEAFDAAAAAAANQLTAWLAAQDDLDALLPLIITANARLNAWLAAVAARNDACDNFPPTLILCAEAQVTATTRAAELVAALVPLGLEAVFDSPTLGGVLANLRASAEQAVSFARGLLDAAEAARDAALATLVLEIAALEPRWQSRQCHRSARSGQVLAAALLEESDPRSSVTFIHLACSGAKVGEGLLDPYEGQERTTPFEAELPPQVDEAAGLAAGRPIDALVVSIGGNDANFSKAIQQCVFKEPCFSDPALDDPTVLTFVGSYCAALGPVSFLCEEAFDRLYADRAPGSAAELFAIGEGPGDGLGIDDLPGNYDALQARLVALRDEGMLPAVPRVYLTGYPNITRREGAAKGAPTETCGFDPLAPLEGRLRNLPAVTLPEFLWAEEVAAPTLASVMEQSAGEHGWRFVTDHADTFDGHGYCADDNWIVRIDQSFANQIRPALGTDAALNGVLGAVHPNPRGHVEYGDAISQALYCDHYPGCDPTQPRRLAGQPIAGEKLVVRDVDGRARKRRLLLLSKSPSIEAPAPGPDDPTQTGATLRLASFAGGDDTVFPLPAAGWSGIGRPAGTRGYEYKDRAGVHGPCTRVLVRPGKLLRATCKGEDVEFSLDEPEQGALGATLTLGTSPTLCMEFGGTIVHDEPASGGRRGRFQAKDAPVPVACALP